jgi:ABC-type phosphate transport system substrate-binding protein
MLAQFEAAGFNGTVTNTAVGSSAGLAAFCAGEVDIAASSRPIKSGEFETCRTNGRFPLEFQVGIDTLAIVVNANNSFVRQSHPGRAATAFHSPPKPGPT